MYLVIYFLYKRKGSEYIMRKIILYIAMSLDGYIARKDQSVDWLDSGNSGKEQAKSYDAFVNSLDTVIMGRNTYEQIINELSPGNWPYKGKRSFVATTQSHLPNTDLDWKVETITGSMKKWVESVKKEPGKDIWLIGGAKLIKAFTDEDLIDKYIITVVPTILGEGIPLFYSMDKSKELVLENARTIDGYAQLSYLKKRM